MSIRPQLDVTDVLGDPEFADEFIVIRRTQATDSHGKPRITSEVTFRLADGCYGVVVPTGDNSMVRADAFEAQSNSIQVITPFDLIGPSIQGTTTWLPDLIQWEGGTYVVKELNEFSRFGRGFRIANCILYDYLSPFADPNACA